MTRRRQSSKFLFLFLQAMAVAIICFGSLINFHQYKIWGKPLIPNFVGYKRDIEKYSKILSFSKLTRENQNLQKYFSGNDCDLPSEIRYASNVWGGLFSFELCQCFPVQTKRLRLGSSRSQTKLGFDELFQLSSLRPLACLCCLTNS